jgi:hypothetical protein
VPDEEAPGGVLAVRRVRPGQEAQVGANELSPLPRIAKALGGAVLVLLLIAQA